MCKMLSFLSKRNILLSFFLPYLAVLVIPLIMSLLYYAMTVRVVEEDYKNSNRALLEQSSQVLDRRFEELNGIMNQLVSNNNVQNMTARTAPYSYPNAYRLIETRKSLNVYTAQNKFLLDYYLLFNNSETVMNGSITYGFKEFYDLYFSYDGISYEEWRGEISGDVYCGGILPSRPVTLLTYQGENRVRAGGINVITYLQPISSANISGGNIMFIISADEILRLFSKLDTSGGGYVMLLDKTGNIITQYPAALPGGAAGGGAPYEALAADGTERADVGGKNMMISQVTSPLNGLRCVSVQPVSVVLAKVDYIRYSVLILAAVSLLAGLLMAYQLARRSSRPVKEALDEIVGGAGGSYQERLARVKERFSELSSSNKYLTQSIEQQRPLLMVSLLGRLLKGEFESGGDARHLLHLLNADGANNVILFRIRSQSGELSGIKAVVRETVRAILGGDACWYDLDDEKTALLFHYAESGDKQKQTDRFAELVERNLPERVMKRVLFVSGDAAEEPVEIRRSYEQALSALSFNSGRACGYIRYSGLNVPKESYHFPQEVRNRLAAAVRAGDGETARQILLELLRRNLLEGGNSPGVQRLFVYDLLVSVISLSHQLNISNEEHSDILRGLDKVESLGDLGRINFISELYQSICDTVRVRLEEQKLSAVADVRSFLENNYQNPDLSLSAVSERFNINETSLSHLFKQFTGKNISVYIETLRMEKAMELITKTDLLIRDIALNVGYYSVNTFCRAFRRVHNVNASVYRKQNGY